MRIRIPWCSVVEDLVPTFSFEMVKLLLSARLHVYVSGQTTSSTLENRVSGYDAVREQGRCRGSCNLQGTLAVIGLDFLTQRIYLLILMGLSSLRPQHPDRTFVKVC